MSEVKILTLVGGPTIIAKVDFNSKKNCYVLENPLNIVFSAQKETGKPKFSVFEILMLSSESTIEINENNILYSYLPLSEILDQYNTMILNKLIPVDN